MSLILMIRNYFEKKNHFEKSIFWTRGLEPPLLSAQTLLKRINFFKKFDVRIIWLSKDKDVDSISRNLIMIHYYPSTPVNRGYGDC